MLSRLSRLAPLTGVVFAVLAGAAFALSNAPPGAESSGGPVIAFYKAHSSSQQASDFLWMLAFAFFVLFAGSLRAYLRRTLAAEALSSVVLAGAAMMAVGASVYFGFDGALAAVPSHLDPAAAQALNVLALKLFYPLSAGGFVFGIASGLAILRGARLPEWLGWVVIAIGIVTVTPGALGGIVAYMIWTVIVSVLIWKRSGTDLQAPLADALGAMGTANG
jgi:hypothetical protein